MAPKAGSRLLTSLSLLAALFASAVADAPTVDLGYAVYGGVTDGNSGYNIYKGIRFAAPPVGDLRWAKPQAPPQTDRTVIQLNNNWPPACPQTPQAGVGVPFGLGNEDCLFLSVVAPPNAQNLPVMVWIHGGGYGGGSGQYDWTEMMRNNDGGFVLVNIQYRLGAFGFLSSDEVQKFGVANAGLWDQEFALGWVQTHISKFGGDPSRVTISGESAGGGSVMTLVLAHGGQAPEKLFNNAIAASPYLPKQFSFNDGITNQAYVAFAEACGCGSNQDADNGSVLDCLRNTDSNTLQAANYNVTQTSDYGTWKFLPVTDGEYLRSLPTAQLASGSVNGDRMLSGNNAEEGYAFVPQNINTEDDFMNYLRNLVPLADPVSQSNIAFTYRIAPVVPGSKWATAGDSGPTAMNQSSFAIGEQQRANNLYGEMTFVCPSYWLADAFSIKNGNGWKYQFSVAPSEHGLDLDAVYQDGYVPLGAGTMSPAFRVAMQKIWGNFIINNDPTLSQGTIDALTKDGNGKPTGDDLSGALASTWGAWNHESYPMLNLNMTAPSEHAIYRVVDGWEWEGKRGGRCGNWSAVGPLAPE